jgi:hypothetical protein
MLATKRGHVCNKSIYELVLAAIRNSRQRQRGYEIVFKWDIFLQNEF